MQIANLEPNLTLKARISSGLIWSAGARVAQQAIQFVLSVVLARLLSPADYGMMAMVLVFTGFAATLADAGFSSALVQKVDLSETQVHTVFWVTIASGLTLTTITLLIAPWLAAFYNAPALKPIFQLVAINFTLASFGNTPSALLQKRMQFKVIAKISTWSLVGSSIVALASASLGAGVWSLVIQALAASLLNSIFSILSSRWLPRFTFSLVALKELWHYAGHLYGFSLVNYWARNADNLLIGKHFGQTALGAYSRAYMLMLLPITQVNTVISQVVFPGFASIQNDKPRVKRIYLRAIGIVTLITFPIMFGLMVTAQPFIAATYGPRWGEVAPILQILAFVGAIQVLVNSTGWIFMSQGRSDVMLRIGVCFSLAVIASFAAGIALGSVRAVALCYCVANVLFLYPWMAAAGRLIEMRFGELLTAVARAFVCSSIMAIIVAEVRLLIPIDWPAYLVLLVLVSSGALLYAVMIIKYNVPAWHDLLGFIGAAQTRLAKSPVPIAKEENSGSHGRA